MKRKLIKVLAGLLIIMFAFGMTSASFSVFKHEEGIPAATEEFYVNDFADVIEPDEEVWLLDESQKLYDNLGIQFVVSTVNTTNNKQVSTYIQEMYEQYNLNSDVGILVLYVKDNATLYISTGDMIKKYVSQSTLGYYIAEYFAPYKVQGHVGDGMLSLQRNIAEMVKDRLSLAAKYPDRIPIVVQPEYSALFDVGKVFFPTFFAMTIIILVVILDITRKSRKEKND